MKYKPFLRHRLAGIGVALCLLSLDAPTALAQSGINNATFLPETNLGKLGIAPADYSGIAPLGGDSFAVVDDKSPGAGFYILHLDIDRRNGKIRNASRSDFRGDLRKRDDDNEDIVFLPSRGTVFLTSEAHSTVEEYTLDGHATGRHLNVPKQFAVANLRPNSGLESLAYDDSTGRFFLTTERSLRSDAPVWNGRDSVELLRIQTFDSTLMPTAQYAYLMEAPRLRRDVKYYAHGVSALLYMGDNRLLVLEREVSVPPSYLGARTSVRLFLVKLATPISPTADASTLSTADIVEKQEVGSFITKLNLRRLNYANYEGLCHGPTLLDGRRTVILICDSQAGAGNSLFHLKDYIKLLTY